MATQKEDRNFFAEFPPITTEEWKAKITTDLKEAPYDKKLVWRTGEGFTVEPFYRREDLEGLTHLDVAPNTFPYIRSTRNNNEWYVRQSVSGATPEAANKEALDILEKGVDSLCFVVKDEWIETASMERLLKDIELTAIEICFTCCMAKVAALLKVLAQVVKARGCDASKIHGCVNYNPFKRELVKGCVYTERNKEILAVMDAAKELPSMRVLAVEAQLFNFAGAYITEQLGCALAWGACLLDTLIEAGYAVEEAAKRIHFNFGTSSNYFMEIAKYRAARWLWAEIVASHGSGDEYKGDCAKIYQHAVSSTWNQTRYDSYVNLLRSQTETMSAALAGVDAISVTPFDTPYGTTDDFSRRLARNQQLLLKEESHFDKVLDPAAGSYYVEVLTDKVAKQSWSIFLEIDAAGGFAQQAESGKIQERINASNAKRHEAIAKRKETLLGTNEFPNFTETIKAKVDQSACAEGHCCGQDHSKEGATTALDFSRGASAFESLRLATEGQKHQPVVFMLTIGNLAMRLARSQFAGNFFGCAGYKLIDNLGFETVEAGVKEALDKKADIIVLCSSDDEYAQYAPEAFKLIDGKVPLVIAGNPACTDDLKALGIRYFVHVKSDVLATLQEFNKHFGIEEA